MHAKHCTTSEFTDSYNPFYIETKPVPLHRTMLKKIGTTFHHSNNISRTSGKKASLDLLSKSLGLIRTKDYSQNKSLNFENHPSIPNVISKREQNHT